MAAAHEAGGQPALPPVNAGVDRSRMPGYRSRDMLAWLAIAAVFANTAWYTWTTANPLVTSDAWDFLEIFVRKTLDGTVTIQDLFVRRGKFDHAQPLNKLFLFVNARYLGLDYVYEAMAGVVFALFGFLVIKRAADDSWRGRERPAAYYLPLVGIAAVFVSLNSSSIFSWPLVTFGYVTVFVVLVTMLLAWRAFSAGRWRWFAVAIPFCAMVADDSGLIAAIAIAMALLWAGARSGRRAEGSRLAAAALLLVALYFAAQGWLDPTPRTAGSGTLQTLQQLAGLATGPDAWRLLIPFASSVVYYGQLEHVAPRAWETLQAVVGALLLVAHGWFWYRASRIRVSAAAFMAISMMLVFYGFIAGILYGRVAEHGLHYFNQPRYVILYQLSAVALLLMAIASAAGQRQASWRMHVPSAAAGILLLVQIPLSMSSWHEAQFNRRYWRTMAAQMGELARDPAVAPASCLPTLVICQRPAERRKQSMELLRQHHLNLFSPEFQRRRELSPG